MLKPSVDSLIGITKSRYSLVTAASKRARALGKGSKITIDNHFSPDTIGIALEEIRAGTVEIVRKENDDQSS